MFNPFDPLGIFSQLQQSGDTDDVKSEFGAPCWEAYNTALRNLRFLAGAHDIKAVMEALKSDLGLI